MHVCVCVYGGGGVGGGTVADSKKRIHFTFYCSTVQYGRVSYRASHNCV